MKMRKINKILLVTVLIMSCISCNQQDKGKKMSTDRITIKSNPKQVVTLENKKEKSITYINGKVKLWITDTVYLTTLPFYSPYSYETFYQTISKDSTFQFDVNKIEQPIILQLAPTKAAIDQNINSLLFANLTDKYYYGQCAKFSTYQVTTYLLEPNDSILVELSFNSWIEKLSDKKAKYLKSLGVNVSDNNTVRDYGKTGLTFLNSNTTSLKYYQKWFAVDNKFDTEIERSKNVKSAYEKVIQLKENLLSDLQQEKSNITPFLYKHLKAYIEFGSRKEFLKNLILVEKYYFKGTVANEIADFLEFNKEDIDFATILCDQYNDYLEFYLTYKMNKETGNTNKYYDFNKEKFEFVVNELPKKSQYYYLANQLLHEESSVEFKDLYTLLIKEYPKGDLNKKMKQKFN